jgi:hypothetical protein
VERATGQQRGGGQEEGFLSIIKAIIWALAACLCLGAQASPASVITPAQIQALRDQARRNLQGSADFANTMAGVINVTLTPDLSSAYYNVEFPGAPDVDFSTTKLPYYHYFELDSQRWSPYLGVVLGYLDAKTKVDTISVTFGERMRWDSNWKGYSGLLEGGVKLKLGKGFYVTPGLSAGLAKLRNSVTYLNDFSRTVAAPVLNGLTTNFSITAMMLSGILGGGYEGKLGPLDLEVVAKYTHSYVESIKTSDPAQDFNDDIDSLAGRVTLGGPLGFSLYGNPVLWQAFVGAFHLVGEGDDAVGWTYYYELGATVGLDIRRLGLPLSVMRLGGSVISGDNVSGWSIIVGYTF